MATSKTSVSPRALFVDRDDERRELRALLARRTPTLALLTGRRRVGKTYLLNHTWPADQLFLFTAAHTTGAMNRRQLVLDVAAWAGVRLNPEDFPTWRTVFRLLVDLAVRRATAPVARSTVVVLDEFQYLADGDGGIAAVASELNAVWESIPTSGTPTAKLPLLLLLSGSAVSTMDALAGGGSPLYGRLAWVHTLRPFTYWHADEMTGLSSLRERAMAYGVFGGTPRYLAALDVDASLRDNIIALMLSPRGEVRQLIETALDQEDGLREVPKYRAILRAVADGCTMRNTIAQRTGLDNDHALRAKLDVLLGLGYLESHRNIDAKPNDVVRYRMADSAFRFHHRFVAANASMLERYPATQAWELMVAPQLDAYMGIELERIAVEAYDRLAPTARLPLVRRWGRWEGVDRLRVSLEIDLIAEQIDGRWLTGAVKWSKTPIGPTVHDAHIKMLQRAAAAGRSWAHGALRDDAPLLYVSAAGFTPAFHRAVARSGRPVICWTLEDLYRSTM